MRIDAIHIFINDLLMKELGGYESPSQIDTALERANMSVFKKYLPFYATSQEAKDALSPFLKSVTFTTGTDGKYTIPSNQNYERLTSIGIAFTDTQGARTRKVRLLPEDAWEDAKISQVRKPTITKPIGLITGLGSFELFPTGVAYGGTVRFLITPATPKYAYTESGRDFNYDDTNSVQLEWSQTYQNEVILKAIEFLGLNLGEDRLVEVGEALINANS